MNILLAGATGLIGKRLVAELARRGHTLHILSRSQRPGEGTTHYHRWDGVTFDHAAIGPVDAVINLAGAGIADHKWTPAFKKEILDSRINSTRALVQYIQAQEQKPRVLLQAAAVGYYGTDAKKVFEETDGPGKDFLSRVCAPWEAEARAAGIRTVWLRTGIVLAPEGGAFPKLLAPFKFYAGGYLGDGKQPFPWIHIDDMIGVYLFCLENERVEGPLNVAAPEQMTNRGFARVLGRVVGRPSGLPVPAFAIRAMLGEQALLVLEGQYVKVDKLLGLGYSFRYPQAEAAVREIATAQR